MKIAEERSQKVLRSDYHGESKHPSGWPRYWGYLTLSSGRILPLSANVLLFTEFAAYYELQHSSVS